MRESIIEKYLVKQVKALGGMCIKLLPFNFAGLPDRLIILPMNKIYFVETKSTIGRLSLIQRAVHRKLLKIGVAVTIINSKEQVNEFLNKVA